MSVLVVYKSLSGFTEKYARWLAGNLEVSCLELGSFRPEMVDDNTVIVFGGSLHAVGINGYKKLKGLLKNRNYRELVVFAVGASPSKPGIEKEIADANFLTQEEKIQRLYYLRGGFDYSRLNRFNKLLMNMMKFKIKKKRAGERTADEKGMLAAFDKPVDFTRQEKLEDLIGYLKNAQTDHR